MKIISKFKDYYDGVQAMGFDNSLIYVRHQVIKSFKRPRTYQSYLNSSNDTLELDRINLETNLNKPNQEHIKCTELEVGFCGKLYPTILFQHIKNEVAIGKKVLYNSSDIIKYIAQLKSQYGKINACRLFFVFLKGYRKWSS